VVRAYLIKLKENILADNMACPARFELTTPRFRHKLYLFHQRISFLKTDFSIILADHGIGMIRKKAKEVIYYDDYEFGVLNLFQRSLDSFEKFLSK